MKKRILSAMLCLCMVIVVLPTVSFAVSNTTTVGVSGRYILQQQEALDLINQYRYEACREGVANPMTGQPLTLADYVPIKWSSDLEYIARVRAAEARIMTAHTRPNGDNCFSVCSPNDIWSCGEVLAWNGTDTMLRGVEQWYGEKYDWVNNTGGMTGHYECMISPGFQYVGLASFYNTELNSYSNCTAGEFSYEDGLEETMNRSAGTGMESVEVSKNKLTNPVITGKTEITVGKTSKLSLTVSYVSAENYGAITGLPVLGEVNWTTTNAAAAKVDSTGCVTAVGEGTATITAQDATGIAAQTTVTVSSFTDVAKDKYYAAPVSWAVSKGITNGTGEDTFSPEDICTRAQVVTFLWRAKGEPKPTGTNNPFHDVVESDYYYKAVLWAVENGVTSGTSESTFSPNDGCTRAQVAAFLWRTEGQPDNGGSNPFIDVDTGAYYGKAVLWAVAKNITNGTSANTFAPDMTCTRGQIVTFLYRDMA